MSDIAIEGVRDGDLAEILRNFERFWGDRDLPRYLHHPMFFLEFGDTAFVARDPGRGEIAGYLLGFVAPSGDGYIHFVAVRDDSRTLGLGRRLYEAFENAARERGAVALKAITSPENEGFCGVSQPRRLHRDDPHRGLWRRRPDTHRDAQAALVSCLSQE